MKPSPCLKPLHVLVNGVERCVPCGKCAACLVNKGRARSQKLDEDLSSYPFQFFVTLTYSDDFLPIAKCACADCNTLVHPHDKDYKGLPYHYDLGNLSEKDSQIFGELYNDFNGIPVLSHRDAILFKKRFRYYFKKLISNDAKLFIYLCGEYGPTRLRPHFHLLFGTTANCTTGLFEMCVRYAWSRSNQTPSGAVYQPFGRIDVQRVTSGNCNKYVAQYLNCFTNLPSFLVSNVPWRPFASSSRDGLRLHRIAQDDLRKVFSNPTLYVIKTIRGKRVISPVPSEYVNKYFPLMPRFGTFVYHELVALYRTYLYYPYESEVAFEKFIASHERLVDVNLLNVGNAPFNGNNKRLLPDLLVNQVLYCVCFYTKDGDFIDEYETIKRNFLRVFYISRRVCFNAFTLGISVSCYVDNIIKYHINFELDKLKRFYEMQIELMEGNLIKEPLKNIFGLYYNTSCDVDYDYYSKQFGVHSALDVKETKVQSAYAFQSEGILLDTTKTKKRNDVFSSRGLVRKPYIPILKKNINRFNSI